MSRSRVLALLVLAVIAVALVLPPLASADVAQSTVPRRNPTSTPRPAAVATRSAKPAPTPVDSSPIVSPGLLLGVGTALGVLVGLSAFGLVVIRRRHAAGGVGSPGA